MDLSWTSASAARHICNWRVAVDTESLSDHRYVFMEVLERIVGPLRRVATEKHFPRWCVRRINVDLLCAAANVKAWSSLSQRDMSAEQLADRIDTVLKEISDVAMPRLKTTDRSPAYWWNEEIADLRVRCVRIRRCILRRRRKYQDTEMIRSLWDGLREAKKLLKNAIRKSKLTL